MKILLALPLLFLAACASTPSLISGAPPGTITITNSTVVTDLQDASYNLDNALAVGALAADDPAPKCLHDVLVKAGIEVPAGSTPAKTFVPKYGGVASTGAVAYILAQQAKAASKVGITVDVSCEALVGRVVLDGAATVNKAAVALIPGAIK